MMDSTPRYTIPQLDYSYKALEPYIDAKTMELHYTKHHQGYVNKSNKALDELNIDYLPSLEELFKTMDKYPLSLRNNAGGHYNHTLFWSILSPTPQNTPTGDFAHALLATFGSIDNFKEKFTCTATSHFGSGWAWLVLDSEQKLVIGSTSNQDNPLMSVSTFRGTPLLGIDVWEHAYYLNYQNKRADYIEAIWKIVDWKKIEAYYYKALR